MSELATVSKTAIISSELHGPMNNGGIGTSYTALAEALAEASHSVSFIFIGEHLSEEPMEHWVSYYQEKGIELIYLGGEEVAGLRWQYDLLRKSYLAYQWLREQEEAGNSFDVIHYPECNGHGFYTAMAKRQGLAFQNTHLCVGAHSSTAWIYESSGRSFSSVSQLMLDYMEQKSIEWSCSLVSPSQYLVEWMKEREWKLPAHVVVRQNIQPPAQYLIEAGIEELRERSEQALPVVGSISTLVFFGRLEARKGLPTFCDSLDQIATQLQDRNISVTFLGKETMIEGVSSADYLAERAKSGEWSFPWSIEGNCSQEEANAYLRQEGHLAIMPSPVDNSPNTVLECIGQKIPFLATRAGGIPELIDQRDIEDCTFYHQDSKQRSQALASSTLRVLEEGQRPARRAVAASETLEQWLNWHQSLAGLHTKAGAGLPADRLAQNVILVNLSENNKQPAISGVHFNKSLSYQALRKELLSDEQWLLFWDEEALAVALGEKEGRALNALLVNPETQVITGMHDDPSATGQERSYYPIGASVLSGAYLHCYGNGPFFLRAGQLELLEQSSELVGTFDNLADYRAFFTALWQKTVPQELAAFAFAQYPAPVDPHAASGQEPTADLEVLAELCRGHSTEIRQLMEFSFAKQKQADALVQQYYDLQYRVGEGYEKLEEKFQEQSVWLEEREALLQKTAEELAEMKKKLASYESSKETESAAEEDAESDSEKKPWLRKILG